MPGIQAARTVEQFAPAKINLYLHVVGRRPDGYHLLDSLVVFAEVGDRLQLSDTEGLSLRLDGPQAGSLSSEPDNLVLRAARSLAAYAGIPPRASIRLEKHLPVSAGIGGGSADAAATLRGLSQLWGLTMTETAMAEVGVALGADLPVCLRGQPTQMAGIGESLTPAVAMPNAWLLLVNPRQGLSTPLVFQRRTGSFSPAAPLTEAPADAAALAEALRLRHNDLAGPAQEVMPVIAEMLEAIAGTQGCLLARMSGSGATCFGLYATDAAAKAAAAALTAQSPHWWIAPARLLKKSL